ALLLAVPATSLFLSSIHHPPRVRVAREHKPPPTSQPPSHWSTAAPLGLSSLFSRLTVRQKEENEKKKKKRKKKG
ncbi:Os01g0944100, partial [Oryza sativa Japonica Group]